MKTLIKRPNIVDLNIPVLLAILVFFVLRNLLHYLLYSLFVVENLMWASLTFVVIVIIITTAVMVIKRQVFVEVDKNQLPKFKLKLHEIYNTMEVISEKLNDYVYNREDLMPIPSDAHKAIATKVKERLDRSAEYIKEADIISLQYFPDRERFAIGVLFNVLNEVEKTQPRKYDALNYILYSAYKYFFELGSLIENNKELLVFLEKVEEKEEE